MSNSLQINLRSSLKATRRAVRFLVIAAIAAGFSATLWISHNSAQSEAASIVGVVQDDQSAPVANATVRITTQDFEASAQTQADGRFEFKKLKPGKYRLTASAARFRKETLNITITRVDETVTQAVIKLAPSSLHVAVLDAGNQPLGSVTVTLYFKERGAERALAERRTTDEAGDAFFGRLTQGSYQLTATLRGYDEYRNDVFISSGITTEFPLQLLVAPVIPMNEKAVSRYGPPNLPSKNVQCVFQDSEAWLWFGTDKGLARFNGSDFKSSATAGSGLDQFAGEDVRSIAEDQSGAMWLATATGVRRITKHGVSLEPALAGYDARRISVDAQGVVWIAMAEGLFKFDGSASLLTRSQGLPSNDVRSAVADKDGRVWIATAAGVVILEGNKVRPPDQREGSPAHSPQPVGSTTPASPPQQEPVGSSASSNDAGCVFVDKRGAVWVATAKGVQVFDANRTRPVLIPGGEVGVRAITEDQNGRMWYALESGGVLVYDPDTEERQRLSFLDRDHVSAILPGREGHIWCGTDNGAVNADLYSFVDFTTSRGLADNDVLAIVEPPGNQMRLWILTASGVSRSEGERFAPLEGFRATVGVRAAAFDRSGDAWFATEQGALRLTGQTLTQFNEGSGLAGNNCNWVASASDGAAIIFATSRGASIFRNGQLKSIDALAGHDVRHVFEDWDGRLWFSTGQGVVSFDVKSGETQLVGAAQGLADNDARWITRFGEKLVIATRGGVQFYGGGTDFRTLDGEPASTLFVDRDGFLWAGTDDGQVKKFVLFGGHTMQTVYSGEVHALTASRINSFHQDSLGRIWIGSDKGAVRHVPLTAPPPARMSIEVDGRTSEEASDLGTGSYEIPYGRHRITFHFAGISMSGQVRYLYRINPEGAEGRWEVLPIQQGAERDVSVLDLSEGRHTFELIALNRDLYGSSEPAARRLLRIGAPFWKRWWFYAILLTVAALAAGAVFAAHRLREREYVLPRELRSFVPIEPNPYIVGNPIRSEQMFFGREDDFRYVRTKLEGASQGVVIVFCGDRRVGKSSILYQVLNGRLGDRFVPVFVDLQEMVVASDAELFARMTRLIAEAVIRANNQQLAIALGEDGKQVEQAANAPAIAASPSVIPHEARALRPLVVPGFDGGNPYPLFLDFLDEALQALGDRTLLILMDEYELMEGKVDEGKLSSELFTFLAGLMDNKERLAFIFTGSRRLEERDKKYWRELLRRSLFRKVGFLSEGDAVRLITEPVEGRVVYGRGVVDVISRLTAGQPFYAQMVCQNTVDYLNQHEQNWVTLADLTHVIADIIDNPLPQMIYTWDALSDDEKIVLSLLAETLPDGIDYSAADQLRSAVKTGDYPVNLSENTIRLTLEEMFRRELLEKDAGDGFRFKIDLFRLWIRRSHSIWQVVKEVRTL
ncbi:MAG TPA: two-component regulator propeller domain-containing protein [Blastocatellia bacterium]|nr:two-component regulator propeller domain-containing protein [Blastocatellia bacterium]